MKDWYSLKIRCLLGSFFDGSVGWVDWMVGGMDIFSVF